MELRWLAAAAGVSVALVLLAVLRRELVTRGARRRAFAIAGGVYVLAAAGWLLVLTTPTPAPVAWVASIPAAVLTMAPGLLVHATGPSPRTIALLDEVRSLRLALTAPVTTDLTDRRLRERLRALGRFRAPHTIELIELVQEEGFEALDGSPVDAGWEARRRERIDTLIERLSGEGGLRPR